MRKPGRPLGDRRAGHVPLGTSTVRAGAGEIGGGGQPVVATADNDRVVTHPQLL